MQERVSYSIQIGILTATSMSCLMLAIFTAHLWLTNPPHEAPAPAHVGATVTPAVAGVTVESIGAPIRLIIPSIAVDANIEQVTITSTGAMEVPKDPMNTGWYALGPRPGETGSSAIAGHVDWLHGASGVFANLHTTKPGATITVENDAGERIDFVVREIKTFDPAADATEVFSSQDGLAHLNLITCNGVWDKVTDQYSERLVVFADRL